MKLVAFSAATAACTLNVINVLYVAHSFRIAHALMSRFQRTLKHQELKDTLQQNLPSLRGRVRDGMALYKRMTAT